MNKIEINDMEGRTQGSRMSRTCPFGTYAVFMSSQEFEDMLSVPDSRSDAQNRLIWKWNGEIAKQRKDTADWTHGESKLMLLLPQMKVWGGKNLKQANYIEEKVFNDFMCYEAKVFVSYGNIRTKTLGVKKMSWYLETFQRHYSMQGFTLTQTGDDFNLAMGVK